MLLADNFKDIKCVKCENYYKYQEYHGKQYYYLILIVLYSFFYKFIVYYSHTYLQKALQSSNCYHVQMSSCHQEKCALFSNSCFLLPWEQIQIVKGQYGNDTKGEHQRGYFEEMIFGEYRPKEECQYESIDENQSSSLEVSASPITIYNIHPHIIIIFAMWLKKLFNSEKEDATVKLEPEPMEEAENQKQSKIFTVSQEEVDLRYSNLKIINIKSLHLPANQVHFIESAFFFQKNMIEGKTKFSNEFTRIDDLIITDRQIIMIPDIFTLHLKKKLSKTNVLHIYFGMIEKVEFIQNKKETCKLQLTLKDSRVFLLQCVIGDKLKDIQKLIRQFGFPNGINKFYAFKYGKINKKIDGWKIYNYEKQMKRQGLGQITFDPNIDIKSKPSHAYQFIENKNFEMSPTYPKTFIVPIGMSQAQLVACSKFRTKQRLPILTYFYQYQPSMFVSLFRCSQIKSGILSNRCEQDQKMIRQIDHSASSISSCGNRKKGVNCKIFDARGYYAAFGNKLAGKGFQQFQSYGCQIEFLNIPNIHAVRDSYNKIKGYNTNKQFIEVLGQSGWLDYLFLILSGAKSMVKSLRQGMNVIVHCSDGWDRTTQLSVLTQLLIDPYYRTIEGFIVLFEKDWRSYGHKFRQRSGQYNHKEYHVKQISPVFIQFLDCVVQVMNQFPLSFEFNMHMLTFIGLAYQSNTYGTFLTNNIKEATSLNLQKSTISIWSDILQNKEQYLNTFYNKDGPKILQISLDSKDSIVWKEFLLSQCSAKGEQWQILRRQSQINSNLKQNLLNYDKQIERLRQKLKK